MNIIANLTYTYTLINWQHRPNLLHTVHSMFDSTLLLLSTSCSSTFYVCWIDKILIIYGLFRWKWTIKIKRTNLIWFTWHKRNRELKIEWVLLGIEKYNQHYRILRHLVRFESLLDVRSQTRQIIHQLVVVSHIQIRYNLNFDCLRSFITGDLKPPFFINICMHFHLYSLLTLSCQFWRLFLSF